MTADVHEWNQLALDLGKSSVRFERKGRQILTKVTADGAREAQAFCPVDTGNLRNSITYEVHDLIGEFGPTAEYGAYVEEGTSVMAPHAYVGPAFDRQAAVLVEALGSLTEVIL